MTRKRIAVGLFLVPCLWTFGCEKPQPVAPPPPAPPPPPFSSVPLPVVETTPGTAQTAIVPVASATPPAATYGGMATPESVLYDSADDRYLVSNVNGKPTDVDNNGFLSVLSPDGKVTQARWIEGGKNKVKLDAPKGMAISNGVLYVADITTVRMFDPKSGEPKGDIKIAGATFLNDVAASPDGKLYISDTGAKGGANGLEPNGTDAVYVIEKGKPKPFATGKDLLQPNGLAFTSNGLIVVSFASNQAYRLDEKGKIQDATKLPKGALDGVVVLPQGDLLVSSWEGGTVYRGKLGGAFEPVLTEQKSPADIGYDTKRNRVLVPHFVGDTVEAYALP